MVNCAVPSCKNDSRRQTKQNSNVTFHRFPRNKELLRKWVEALQRPDWEPTIRSFVCSAHFIDSAMYFSKSGLRKLVQDAVPQISLENIVPQKPKSRRKGKSSKVTLPAIYVPGCSPDEPRKKRRTDFSLDNVKKERVDVSGTRRVKTDKGDAYSERNSDCPVKRKLKKRILNLTKLSQRRRLRCNALYASLNRIRKKVATITGSLKDLQQKISVNGALGQALEAYGVTPQHLFQGLGNKDRSCSPEPHEEEFFYSEIPNDIENYVESQASHKQITIYSTSVPSQCLDRNGGPDVDVEVSVVKTESSSPRRGSEEAPAEWQEAPEPVFVDMNAVCRVCLLNNVSLYSIGDELRDIYEKIANTKLVETGGSGALCRSCRSALQRCQRFADMTHKAELYHHLQGAVSEVGDE